MGRNKTTIGVGQSTALQQRRDRHEWILGTAGIQRGELTILLVYERVVDGGSRHTRVAVKAAVN